MHEQILTKEQIELLPLIRCFSKEYYLVGGTAIALHIGHRRSIDFDLFTGKTLRKIHIRKTIGKSNFPIQKVLYEDSEQIHFLINSVKLTFFHYPYSIDANIRFRQIISMPDLLHLAAMKANALGRRGKWKDYVDLYFLFKKFFSLSEVTDRAVSIFQNAFNAKLFRQQLCYFDDVDFSERVEFIGDEIPENEIRTFLIDVATAPL